MSTPHRKFSYNGAAVTVSPANILTVFKRKMILRKLGLESIENEAELDALLNFAYLNAQSEIEGTFGFEWADANASSEELKATFQAWLALPADVGEQWIAEINAVDEPPGDPELAPFDGKKKTTPQK